MLIMECLETRINRVGAMNDERMELYHSISKLNINRRKDHIILFDVINEIKFRDETTTIDDFKREMKMNNVIDNFKREMKMIDEW